MQIRVSVWSRSDLVLDAANALDFCPYLVLQACISFYSVSDKSGTSMFLPCSHKTAVAHVVTCTCVLQESIPVSGTEKHINFFNVNFLPHLKLFAAQTKDYIVPPFLGQGRKERDPRKLFRGQKRAPNGPFWATKYWVYCSHSIAHTYLALCCNMPCPGHWPICIPHCALNRMTCETSSMQDLWFQTPWRNPLLRQCS